MLRLENWYGEYQRFHVARVLIPHEKKLVESGAPVLPIVSLDEKRPTLIGFHAFIPFVGIDEHDILLRLFGIFLSYIEWKKLNRDESRE